MPPHVMITLLEKGFPIILEVMHHTKPMFHQVSGMGVHGSGETHGGDVWKHPQILMILGKWGMGRCHIYNIKSIK
jgi:hypothetical protein